MLICNWIAQSLHCIGIAFSSEQWRYSTHASSLKQTGQVLMNTIHRRIYPDTFSEHLHLCIVSELYSHLQAMQYSTWLNAEPPTSTQKWWIRYNPCSRLIKKSPLYQNWELKHRSEWIVPSAQIHQYQHIPRSLSFLQFINLHFFIRQQWRRPQVKSGPPRSTASLSKVALNMAGDMLLFQQKV